MSYVLGLDDRRPITYSSALKKDENVINKVAYLAARIELYRNLWDQRDSIQALVRHHLKLGNQDVCIVHSMDQWIQGSFNVCIPVEVQVSGLWKKLMFRCAMPHKLAEARYPGTVDEKLSCEVATYVWMQDRCCDVRIPQLFGFGFCDSRHFTHERQLPFYVRLWRVIQRSLRVLRRRPALSRYKVTTASHRISTAYMLLEYIDADTGSMLSNTWDKHRKDQTRRERLFRGISRIILSLASVPQPRIGSFEFHSDGTIALTNRPLPCSVMILENEGAVRTIQRHETYSCVEPFIADMLSLHDESFLSDPNAVYSDADCRGHMAARVLLRALSHLFIGRERRNGPFCLQLTDLHASNILVDENWNVRCLIDLEWVCALPVNMLSVPYWLTGCGIDELEGENLQEFEVVREEFMRLFEEEEITRAPLQTPVLARAINDSWRSGIFWFWRCLTSVNAMYTIVEDHICPKFSPLSSVAEDVLAQYWCQGSGQVVQRKGSEREWYAKELQVLFSKPSIGAHPSAPTQADG